MKNLFILLNKMTVYLEEKQETMWKILKNLWELFIFARKWIGFIQKTTNKYLLQFPLKILCKDTSKYFQYRIKFKNKQKHFHTRISVLLQFFQKCLFVSSKEQVCCLSLSFYKKVSFNLLAFSDSFQDKETKLLFIKKLQILKLR